MKRVLNLFKYIGYVLGVLALIAVLGIATWWLRLPSYHGANIHQWFRQALSVYASAAPFGIQSQTQEIVDAFDAMGADGGRFLLRKLNEQPSFRDYSRLPWNYLAGPRAPKAIRGLFYQTPMAHWVAHDVLVRLGPRNVLIREDLEKDLRNGGGALSDILEIITVTGVRASNCAEEVSLLFNHKSEAMRSQALSAFGAITPRGSPQVKLLRDAVLSKKIRASAAIPVLRRLGEAYSEMLPMLGREFLPRNTYQDEAFQLYKMLPKKDQLALLNDFVFSLCYSAPRTQADGLMFIRALGRDASPEVPLILPLLNAEYYYVRAETARALERIREPRLEIMSELKNHLNDTNAEVRETVQGVLERLASEKALMER
jgi:hypothetical protein